MTVFNISDPDAVLRAVAEFDRLGRDRFLRDYGFGPAKSYFLEVNGKKYDSKAIIGVAHGYQFPAEGPLRASDFSGGQTTVASKLQDLGFVVRFIREGISEQPAPRPQPAIVLVENEATVDARYDSWEDVTGERYHFPNQYRHKITTGRRFVYYRGSRRAAGPRGVPGYFGHGIVGAVTRDPQIAEGEPQRRWKWIAEIEDYRPFELPVPAKMASGYLEQIPRNLWQVPRDLPEDIFEKILELGGAKSTAEFGNLPRMPPIEEVRPRRADAEKVVLRVRPERSPTKSVGDSAVLRRSPYSRAIGNRAEQVVLNFLNQDLPKSLATMLRWPASMGERPGWDIEYRDGDDALVAVEAKGTAGPEFPAFELTAQEWRQAERLRRNYRIFLVVSCLSTAPVIRELTDPYGLMLEGRIAIEPIVFRLEARGYVG